MMAWSDWIHSSRHTVRKIGIDGDWGEEKTGDAQTLPGINID
jgi:hypothetical protein